MPKHLSINVNLFASGSFVYYARKSTCRTHPSISTILLNTRIARSYHGVPRSINTSEKAILGGVEAILESKMSDVLNIQDGILGKHERFLAETAKGTSSWKCIQVLNWI